jgi:hypothetical protein
MPSFPGRGTWGANWAETLPIPDIRIKEMKINTLFIAANYN